MKLIVVGETTRVSEGLHDFITRRLHFVLGRFAPESEGTRQMETSHIESIRSCVTAVRRKRSPHDVTTPDQAAEGVGHDASWAASLEKASHAARADGASVGGPVHMTTSELETHLVRAIAARTHGQIQALTVRILGGRTVLGGFAESYDTIQLAVVGLQEAVDALGLDRLERVDLNIDVMPSRPARP